MISPADRQEAIAMIEEAVKGGARQEQASEMLEITDHSASLEEAAHRRSGAEG